MQGDVLLSLSKEGFKTQINIMYELLGNMADRGFFFFFINDLRSKHATWRTRSPETEQEG